LAEINREVGIKFSVFRSVRGKTILYFSVVLALSTIVTGGACYFFFSGSYRSSLERQNHISLTVLANQLDQQVCRHAKQQRIELTENRVLYRYISSFFSDPVSQRNVKIVNVVSELKSLVAFSNGVVEAVDIYDPEYGTSVSSLTGFTDLTQEPAREDRLLWEAAVQNRKFSDWWDLRKINSHQGVRLVYFGTAPNSNTAGPGRFLAFSLNPQVLNEYLSVQETEDIRLYLLNDELQALYGDAAELESCLSEVQLRAVTRSGADGMVHPIVSNNPGLIVSSIRLAEAPMTLFSVTSTGVFREGMNEIMSFILLISLGVLLAGLTASGFFSQRLYSPLKQLVASVGEPNQTKANYTGTEYSYINQAIEKLSQKTSEYEKTFNDYLVIMRYGFLQSLFNRQFADPVEIFAKAGFLNIDIPGPGYRILRLYLSRTEKSSASNDILAYNILSFMESLSMGSLSGAEGLRLYGIKNTDMSLLVLCSLRESGPLDEAAEEINRYCRERFAIPARLCVSGNYENLPDIYQGIEEIEAMEPYLFFCPGRFRLNTGEIPALSTPCELPPPADGDFERLLNVRSLAEAGGLLDRFRVSCAGLEYTADSCRRYCSVLMQVFVHYVKIHKLEKFWETEALKLENAENIDVFCTRLYEVIRRAFELTAGRNKTALLISNLLIYIDDHYTEPISLDSAADHFGVSARYVGKLVKEETGETFPNYLNKIRLDAAAALLRDSSLSIEAVALKTGFNSAGYFIKRFRLRYGMTPQAFRLREKTGA
jgi:AraC-like DNA-binding protein